MCYSKLSSLLNSPSHDVRVPRGRSTKSGCKGSANRTKYQIYLSISEMLPTFRLRSRLKLVQTERKCKFICDFPPTRYESVGCDDGRFISPKEYCLPPLNSKQNENADAEWASVATKETLVSPRSPFSPWDVWEILHFVLDDNRRQTESKDKLA